MHYLLVVRAKLIRNIYMQDSATRTRGFLLDNGVMGSSKIASVGVQVQVLELKNPVEIKGYVQF